VPLDVPAARTTKTLLLPNMHIMLSYQWVSMQPRLFFASASAISRVSTVRMPLTVLFPS
jgi:hypothetical protein